MTLREASREVPFRAASAWRVLVQQLLVPVALVAAIVWFVGYEERLQAEALEASRQTGTPVDAGTGPLIAAFVLAVVLTFFTWLVTWFGFFIVQPNVARVLVLFGRYRGTVREDGFYWTNPFTLRHRLSVKAHNVASEKIKVNDVLGNPIEIGAVVVWQVRDTAQARFDVENFENYVNVQIETAIRHLASSHPYEEAMVEGAQQSLRGSTEALADELKDEVQRRLDRAGVHVLDTRITHLAYAPEIASAMLQRQQATAIIAARRLIVEGAVGMVEHALEDLSRKKVIVLDDERKATLVGNLLVVLCGHSAPSPVINAGSLYS
jgi:regulator of protease activity HflC (stomatin/prohibitin superfamily)